MQAKIAKDCEEKIARMREMAVQTGKKYTSLIILMMMSLVSGEESIKSFLSQVKLSYESMLGKLRQ